MVEYTYNQLSQVGICPSVLGQSMVDPVPFRVQREELLRC
jgi:hypothetical protein